MADRSLHGLLRYIHRMVGPPPGVLTDGELLGRFVDHRDEAAFEALVWRHGSMVLGVCRRVLRQDQDAEDAFQAAFLALARKAASVRRRGAVGPWLYRVALRVALRAQDATAASKSHAPLPEALPAPVRPDEAEQRELRRILEEEIQRLPSKYREVVLLRYLEGRSTAETATALGCPAGTVLSRLSWARRRLQARLTARGAAFGATIAAAAASGEMMGAPPFRWVAEAVRGAVAFTSKGSSALGTTRSALLAEGALRAMTMTKMKVAAVLILGLLTSGTILHAQFNKTVASIAQDEAPQTTVAPGGQPPSKVEPPEVTVVRPIKREITEYLDFNGQSEASASVEIRPRMTATLTRIVVQPGGEVKRGDLLFELDARALELSKQKAEAQLRQAQATLDEAKNALEEAKNLEQKRLATPSYTEKAAFATTHAVAAVNAARAQWDQAKLDLDAIKITAPMAGRVGRCPLSVGSLATPSTILTTLVACEPIKVAFDMDENSFMRLRKHLPGVGSGPLIAALMALPTEEGFPRGGFVESMDNRFNPATGTIRICAVFPNPHHEILPGMFVRIRLLTDRHEAILVPEESIWSDQGLKYVRVVNGKNAIEQRKVTLGQINQGLRPVQDGLGTADRVVLKAAGPLQVGQIVKAREVALPNQDSKAKPGADLPGSKK